jgi:hypothetical protein
MLFAIIPEKVPFHQEKFQVSIGMEVRTGEQK